MEDDRDMREGLLTPAGGRGGGPYELPEDASLLPAVDDRLAPPETRIEYLHGIELCAEPADEPHATRHSKLVFVLEAHVRRDYTGAVDMLTRTGRRSDFAPDASVFPSVPDPVTGGRQLEELAFEVTSEQALRVPTTKARELVRRGVRRVFCILVAQRRVLEWSRETDGWATVPEGGVIEDRCLVRPLPVRALLDSAVADDAVAAALLGKHVPCLERALEERQGQGEARGRAESVLSVLQARGVGVSAAARDRILSTRDVAILAQWLHQAVTAKSEDDLSPLPSGEGGRPARAS
jgi:hypothetical protein